MPGVINLTTYAGLQDAIAQWLNRTDLTNQITGFIAMAEASMSRRIRRKTITNSVGMSQQSNTLPTDCTELRSIRPVTSSQTQDEPIEIVTPEVLAELRASRADAPGRPLWAAVLGPNIILCPTPDQAYTMELRYFEKLVPLGSGSPAATTNSILAEAPDVYVYGSLLQAAPFLEDDERIPVWQAFFDNACAELDDVRNREESMASIRRLRLPVVFGEIP